MKVVRYTVGRSTAVLNRLGPWFKADWRRFGNDQRFAACHIELKPAYATWDFPASIAHFLVLTQTYLSLLSFLAFANFDLKQLLTTVNRLLGFVPYQKNTRHLLSTQVSIILSVKDL